MLKFLVSEPCVRRCRHIETHSNHALTGAYVSNQSTNGGVRQQCVLHNLTFYDQIECFSYLQSLQRDVKQIMPITRPKFYEQPMSFKFALIDSYSYKNKYTRVNLKNISIGLHRDLASDQQNISIGMLAARHYE